MSGMVIVMTQMIRKQIYIGRTQQLLLARLATARGLSESEVIRQAIEQFMSAGLPISLSNPLVTTSSDTSVIFFDWKINGVAPNGTRVDLHGRAMDVLKLGKDNQWRQLLDLPFGAATKPA